jgi:hypothetical protein
MKEAEPWFQGTDNPGIQMPVKHDQILDQPGQPVSRCAA